MKVLEQRVLTSIKRYGLWKPKDVVTLAISGGVDSMVMLEILLSTQRSHKAELRVVTFDHGLRSESEQEVEMVKETCVHRNISCTVERLHIQKGPRLQERARMARRTFLEQCDGYIATAHHASDQAETVLFRLLRGSGLDGLQGMQRQHGRWVKPLLDIFKPEIYTYADKKNLNWCEDPSNDTTTRGEIRRVWEYLTPIRSNPEKSMSAVANLLSRDADFIQTQVSLYYKEVVVEDRINVSALRKHHIALQTRLIREWLWSSGVNVGRQHVEQLLYWNPSENGQSIQLSSEKRIRQHNGLWQLC